MRRCRAASRAGTTTPVSAVISTGGLGEAGVFDRDCLGRPREERDMGDGLELLLLDTFDMADMLLWRGALLDVCWDCLRARSPTKGPPKGSFADDEFGRELEFELRPTCGIALNCGRGFWLDGYTN